MVLSRHEQRLLHEMDAAMTASDSRLASMLAMFNRLTAGEPLPRPRAVRTRAGEPLPGARARMLCRIWAAVALVVALIAGMIAYAVMASAGH